MADQQSSGDPQMLDANNWLYFTFYWFKRSVFFDYYIWALLIHQWTINSSFIMANGLIIIHEMCLGLSKCSSSAPIINYSISKRWLINAELVIHLLVEKRIHLKFIGDELFIHCWLKGYLFVARWIIDYLCVFCARGPHLGLIYVHEDPKRNSARCWQSPRKNLQRISIDRVMRFTVVGLFVCLCLCLLILWRLRHRSWTFTAIFNRLIDDQPVNIQMAVVNWSNISYQSSTRVNQR